MNEQKNEQTIQINNNHSFWTFRDIYETNKASIHNRAFHVEGSKLIIGATHDERRKIISVFNTVERLNKHPSLYLNLLKLLVESKGMLFTIDAEPLGKGEFMSSRDRETDYKMQSVLNAEDLTNEEYEELSKLKKQGKTTTEDNARCERYYYKRFLALDELTKQDLKAFIYGENPLNNYLSLIDIRNHHKEDNLKSAKFIERSQTV